MKKLTFGEYVRKLRLEKRIGLRQFAKLIDMLPSNLCHLESGRHKVPHGVEFLHKIAKALKLKKGSSEYEKLFDVAAHPGELPADVKEYFIENNILQELPVMARTIKNEKLTRTEIEKLIKDIRKRK
ncbi:MAG: helix-turn-helix domain-containing protein [Candidatus Omnitrophica bacterium]|nr:helix-turn-helix domain-containing protein [Candidatus Omnitrophota bacterium]